ncbi:MAG: hypothetical protein PVH78_01885 [Deltaproteobacteria bacterium]
MTIKFYAKGEGKDTGCIDILECIMSNCVLLLIRVKEDRLV